MRRLAAALVLVAAAVVAGPAADVPRPTGFVTDLADALPPETEARIVAVVEELQARTGAEIAVVTVDTTAPLDDFTYAMQIADAWKPGRKGEDTGIVFLVAVGDRKVRILTGYGLEGILPDGLVGEIIDRDVLPHFRAGRLPAGVVRGVETLAGHVAAARGVTLTGVPPPRARRPARASWWPVVFLAILVLVVLLLAWDVGPDHRARGRRRRRHGGWGVPGGYWGSGRGFGGGFGGGGGGFGGFGGGGFGGGGAGRSW